LPASNKPIKPIYYILVGLWLLLVVVSFIYLVKQRLVSFDDQSVLINTPIFEMLQPLSTLNDGGLKQTIFHFYDAACSCTALTKDHKAVIDNTAVKDNFNIVNIDITANPQFDFIPSTPAILITDKNEQLLYVGPYSTGLDCSANNSLIEVVLSNYRQGFSSPIITSDAQGCYCSR